MSAITERLVGRSATPAQRDTRLVNRNLVSIGIEKVDWAFDDEWAILRRTNCYFCHSVLLGI
jgi:hypothetical protein